MKPKTKFLKMFYKLPQKARRELVLNAYGDKPMTLDVIYFEIGNNTPLGEYCLNELGYEEEVDKK